MTYANQAGSSWPKPPGVVAAVADALVAPPETWDARFEEQRSAIARAFGIGDASRLLLTGSATSALAVGISELPWESGDRVLVSALEHDALYRPVCRLAARGVEIVVLPRTDREPVVLDVLETELRRGRVRLVAMTAASNVTGELLPIAAVAALAREHGALTLIDGAQVAGWLPIYLDTLGADLFAFAGHKGPHGPWGIGGLYVAPHVVMSLQNATLPPPREIAPGVRGAMPGYCDTGSADRTAMAGLVAGLDWVAAPERAGRLTRARKLVAQLADDLRAQPALTVLGPADPAARMPTLAVTAVSNTPAELASGLRARGIIASGGLQCAPLAHATLGTGEAGALRLSLGPSNVDVDVETIRDAFLEVLDDRAGGA